MADVWDSMLGKEIKLIFEDWKDHHSKKQGILKSADSNLIFLEINGKLEGIAISKIMRIEEIKNGDE